MHEASLAAGILETALKAARDFATSQKPQTPPMIAGIVCEAGLFACFEEETLSACFEMLAEGTAAESAKLEIHRKALASTCQNCGHKFNLSGRPYICPVCQSAELSFTGASGLTLLAINIEEETASHD